MTEIAPAEQPPTPQPGRPMEYDAFLSYAHPDKDATTAIQKGLHQIGRRVGQLRALRVFRDDTDLTANPDLWGKITEALDRARYLIVVLSPQAAASPWVNQEITHWVQHYGSARLMLVLAEGHLHWNNAEARFDPRLSDAAPAVLTEPGTFASEPLYIDISDDAPWDPRSLNFRDKITALAAPIHGKPKDQLAGDDLREQRRFRRLRGAAVTALALLTVIAVAAAIVAFVNQREAVRNLREAVVEKLYAQGASMLDGTTPGNDGRAIQKLLAANAIAEHPDPVPILNAQIDRFTTEKIIPVPAPRSLAYSPDGHSVLISRLSGELDQWDCTTGKPVGSPIQGPAGLATATYTPDGKTIASVHKDGTLRLWDAGNGSPLNPHPVPVAELDSIAVTPDGQKIFTGGPHGTIQVWDPRSGQLLATPFSGTEGPAVSNLAIDPTGRWLAGGGYDTAKGDNGGIAIVDIATNQPHASIVARNTEGKAVPIRQIAFNTHGDTLATAGNELQLWDVDTGRLLRQIPVMNQGETTLVTSVAYSPSGHRLAVGLSDGKVQLLDADTGARVGDMLRGHNQMVFSLAFSPDGGQIATTSADGTARLWNTFLGLPMRGPNRHLLDVAFSPDGRRVAASGDVGVQQWDVASGRPLRSLMAGDAAGHWFGYVGTDRVISAADDGTVQMWDVNTGEPDAPPIQLNLPMTDDIMQFAFSPDGHTVAWGRQHDTTVTLWDAATGHRMDPPLTINAPNEILGGFAFSPDGRHLAVGFSDGLRFWNVGTGTAEGPLIQDPELAPVFRVAYSRDGNVVAAASGPGTVEIWDPATHKKLLNDPLQGHNSFVGGVAFGVGHQLATGGADATLRFWDTASGGAMAKPEKVSGFVESVAISPDGRLAAEVTYDGAMQLSPAVADPALLCAKLTTNMSQQQWRQMVSPAIGYITLCPGLPTADD